MPHWSASRFMLFDQCPVLFKERYLDEVPLEPTEALCFGKAVHMGLEAHYNGEDAVRAFRSAWKEFQSTELEGQRVSTSLTATGLSLIETVQELNLEGVPERGFSMDTNDELKAPIVGVADLWDETHNVIYDFKTTIGSWSQQRAQKEVWQPLLYTEAFWQETDHWPTFEYIVCNRATGHVDRFRRQWTEDEYLEQMHAAWRRMRAISALVAADVLMCTGDHGYCPECGDRWSHSHDCRPATPRISGGSGRAAVQ